MDVLKTRGSLLETLRLSRELTQVELAQLAQIPQATLSKVESGSVDLDPQRWNDVAGALNVPVTTFDSAQSHVAPARVFHRRQRSTPKTALRKIGADAALATRRLNDAFGTTLAAPAGLKRYDLDGGFTTPQEIAHEVRRDLGLGTDPIPDLTAVIERAGVLVLIWPLDSLRVDAIATWPEEALPVVLVGEHVPAERQRFTMAHELAHAILHADSADVMDEQEREADAFAAEFLLPRERLREQWPDKPDLETLIPIKQAWGISLSALIRRGLDSGLLEERAYRDWNIKLTTSGMHRREPEPGAPEAPKAVANAIAAALAHGATVDDLAARAHMYTPEFTYTFMEQQS